MGNCSSLCRSELFITVEGDPVPVSCETLFNARFDTANAVEICSHVVQMDLIRSGDKDMVGRKWKETRIYEGRTVQSIVTITAANHPKTTTTDDPTHAYRSVNYSVEYVKHNWNTHYAMQTGTIAVHPVAAPGKDFHKKGKKYPEVLPNENEDISVKDKRHSRLEMTISYVADGCLSGLLARFCGKGISRYGKKHLLREMKEVGVDAIRREQLGQENSSMRCSINSQQVPKKWKL